MANLEINFCGVRIKNPLVAASAEPTLNAKNMKKCIDTGAGGVIAKTMTDSPEMRELTTRAKWRFLNQPLQSKRTGNRATGRLCQRNQRNTEICGGK